MCQLHQAWPEDASVREPLAKGLFLTLIDSKEENDLQRRDALLAEMRRLQQAWPQDAAVRQPLAIGLFDALIQASQRRFSSPVNSPV
jgi:hypothetical protein